MPVQRAVLPIIMVATAACLWGLSGTAAEWLMQADHADAAWLTVVRMAVTGLVLLVVLARQVGPAALAGIWQDRTGLGSFLSFALVGLLGVQFTYLAAIAASNAAMATLLQYLAPILIAGVVAIRLARRPPPQDVLWMLAAVAGTWLLVSDGGIGTLMVSPAGLGWGLLAAGTLAFYTLSAPPLLRRHGTLAVMAWSMLTGAAAMVLVALVTGIPAAGPLHWTWGVVGLVATVAVGGTLLAFGLFLASLSHIAPTTAAWLASVEPVAAGMSAHFFLHVPLYPVQLAGGVLVLLAAALLATRDPPAADLGNPMPG